MSDYIVEPLAPSSIVSAYPLIRLLAPTLDLKAWKRQAGKAIDQRSRGAKGILVARAVQRQYVCGMVWYRSEFDLAKGKFLRANNLIALDLLDSQQIIASLVFALGEVAWQQHCRCVKLVVPQASVLSDILHHVVKDLAPDPEIELRIEAAAQH
ncbi:MAG: hypothetical protein POG74_11075 [Acidocella sp.]|nr:hypothetical protein [Acidocella sp.]